MDMNQTWKRHLLEIQNRQYFDARIVDQKKLNELFVADPNNISTQAVMLEIKDVAGDEHEVEIQDRSKNFSLFCFLRITWKMYRSWKKNKKEKNVICIRRVIPVRHWLKVWRPYLGRKTCFFSKWKIHSCSNFCIIRTTSCLIPGSKWWVSKS